jgi:BirA family biotin operon repressor/biotin-[acetyl-CoA-carboxylase] ligase
LPEPYLDSKLGLPFIELQSVDSTNNYALGQLRAGLAQHGTAFFAHQQVAGKGQRGKIWRAERDSSLILSVALKPSPLPLSAQFQLSACVSVTVVDFFKKYAVDAVKIKWPNDLYWHDRKAGGILIENIIGPSSGGSLTKKHGEQQSSEWQWAVVGIGLNLNQEFFPSEVPNAVSLRQITGKKWEAGAMARELCELLDLNYRLLLNSGISELYDRYLQNLYKRGHVVKLKKGARVFEAMVSSVTPTGELIIKHSFEETIRTGEIEWII